MGAEHARPLLRAVSAAFLLTVVANGCSVAGRPPPTAGAAPRSPTTSATPTGGGPIQRWDSGDPSCAGPARAKSADLPTVLKAHRPLQWFGTGNLWVNAPSVVKSTDRRVKFGSVTLDSRGRYTDAAGSPQVAARRVDGTGTAQGGTGGYAQEADDSGSPHSFWPTTVDFSNPGCWLIIETSGRTTLRFLMRLDR